MLIDEPTTRDLIRSALAEDLAYGPDVTSVATVPDSARAEAVISAHQEGVLAGWAVIEWTLAEVTDAASVTLLTADGDRVAAGGRVAVVSAPTRALLTAERTMLNLLCHLSGVASSTARWVAAVSGTGCRIRDTRKTLPGLRLAQKYAVAAGAATITVWGSAMWP